VQSLVLCYAIILNSTQSCQQLLSKHDAKPARRALLCHPDRAIPSTVLLPGASCRKTALHAALCGSVLTRMCVALRAPRTTAATPGCCSTQRAATHEALTPCFSPTSCSTCISTTSQTVSCGLTTLERQQQSAGQHASRPPHAAPASAQQARLSAVAHCKPRRVSASVSRAACFSATSCST
jgi:hypothetical protein